MSETPLRREPEPNARHRRSDGERSRNAILYEATQLATVEGLNGLSISRLAEAVGMSKSGLFAHFGSKEELQLETIRAASAIFNERVIAPASAAATPLERLRLLAEGFLQHVQGDVFPGGCFFASAVAEMDTHPGPVRDLAVQVVNDWSTLLETAVRDAQAEGAIDRSADPGQLAFDLNAFLLLANAQFVANRTSTPIDRARHALQHRLAQATTAPRPSSAGVR
jgi:AcrR family transcriptional regulator